MGFKTPFGTLLLFDFNDAFLFVFSYNKLLNKSKIDIQIVLSNLYKALDWSSIKYYISNGPTISYVINILWFVLLLKNLIEPSISIHSDKLT